MMTQQWGDWPSYTEPGTYVDALSEVVLGPDLSRTRARELASRVADVHASESWISAANAAIDSVEKHTVGPIGRTGTVSLSDRIWSEVQRSGRLKGMGAAKQYQRGLKRVDRSQIGGRKIFQIPRYLGEPRFTGRLLKEADRWLPL
jgi:hypothetical protein